MKNNKKEIEYYIRSTGKGVFKTFAIIENKTFDLLDMFFDSEDKAKEYAKNKGLKII